MASPGLHSLLDYRQAHRPLLPQYITTPWNNRHQAPAPLPSDLAGAAWTALNQERAVPTAGPLPRLSGVEIHQPWSHYVTLVASIYNNEISFVLRSSLMPTMTGIPRMSQMWTTSVLNAAIVTPIILPSGEGVRLVISSATRVACMQGFEANPDRFPSRGTKLDPVPNIRLFKSDLTNFICNTWGSAPYYSTHDVLVHATDLITRTFISALSCIIRNI